jgi:hypothetical protein
MYWQYTTAFAVSVAAVMNPIVRKANDATAILIFIFFSTSSRSSLMFSVNRRRGQPVDMDQIALNLVLPRD